MACSLILFRFSPRKKAFLGHPDRTAPPVFSISFPSLTLLHGMCYHLAHIVLCVGLLFCRRQSERHAQSKMMGQVEKVTKAESPRCLAMAKLGQQEPYPQGNFSSPSILLGMRFRPPDLSCCWSFGLDAPLTSTPLACC